jgi:hypothetical protein
MNVKREMDELEVKKTSIPPAPETITLHPGSMARFLAHVEQLSKLYAVQIAEDNREAAEAIVGFHRVLQSPGISGNWREKAGKAENPTG